MNLREVLRSSSTDLDISGVKIDGCDDILIVASYDRFQYYSIPAEWKIPKPSRSIKSPTWLVVSPDLGWAVREIGMGESKNASTMWMELSYEGLHGELPILRRSVMHELQVRRRTVLDIDQLHFGPIPEREFTLAAYGLPDLDKPAGTSSRWSLGFIWFGAALATLCVALGLKWYSNRLRNVRRAA
ncbi:MAG: hypothetical protein KGM43_08210 [Planctomycetota bacterium]|nr:hypothetical protein [Planctomycetota bacterium]